MPQNTNLTNAVTLQNNSNAKTEIEQDTKHLIAVNLNSEKKVERRSNPEGQLTLNVDQRIPFNLSVLL